MSRHKFNEDRIKDYETAIAEADRFKGRAKIALKAMKTKGFSHWGSGNDKTAAAKRASMDLTRALAELRRYENKE